MRITYSYTRINGNQIAENVQLALMVFLIETLSHYTLNMFLFQFRLKQFLNPKNDFWCVIKDFGHCTYVLGKHFITYTNINY